MPKTKVKKAKKPIQISPVVAMSAPVTERPMMKTPSTQSPYSLASMLDFLSNNAGLLLLGTSLLIVGFLAGATWRENAMLKAGFGGGSAGAGTAAPQQAEAPAQPLSDENWKKVQENPAGIIGDKNAQVTIVEFTDYQCPFCARHFTNTYKALKEKYVDTGKVKILFKDQALPFHPNAKAAAAAARCAGDQGKFEAMHDALFENQTEWASLSEADAIKKFGTYATADGMNAANLEKCINDGKYKKAIEDDSALGLTAAIGAGGTPTFFVEKQPIVGAQDISVFEAEIEKSL